MEINIRQLNADLREIEEQIRTLKSGLRSTWTKPMDGEQYKLIDLKVEATQRYVLRACARGRFHLADHDKCKEIAEQIAKKYRTEPTLLSQLAANAGIAPVPHHDFNRSLDLETMA
jgi:hypothetical protein